MNEMTLLRMPPVPSGPSFGGLGCMLSNSIPAGKVKDKERSNSYDVMGFTSSSRGQGLRVLDNQEMR